MSMTPGPIQYTVRVAICDDEQSTCQTLAKAIQRYGREHDILFAISAFHSGEELLEGFDPRWHLLFLDIAMGEVNGMDAAKALRQLYGNDLRIVFVTSLEQYALEGYPVHAFGFLVKPVSYARLCFLLDDALRSLAAAQCMQIAVQTDDGTKIVDTSQVLYVESFAHRMRLTSKEGSLFCTTPLKELKSKLANSGFVCCHRCYLVNLRYVTTVKSDECIMTNGDRIPVSRGKRTDFQQAFNKFVGSLL